MNKYQYYVNGNPVTKKEMVKRLKECCYKVTDTMQVGLIGIDTVEFDEKKFNTFYDNARILYSNYANDEFLENLPSKLTYSEDE